MSDTSSGPVPTSPLVASHAGGGSSTRPTSGAVPTNSAAGEPAKLSRRERKVVRKDRRRQLRRARKDWRRSRPGILPRSFLGMALCVLFFAVGAAAAGVGVASYFTWKVDRVEASLNSRIDTITRVPLTDNSPTPAAPGNKTDLAGSIFRVRTLTELGNPDTASAFVATTDGTRVFLLTSLDKLRRATWDSEVTLAVTNGGPEVKASMWSWDEKTKMAVLVANIPGLARIPWVTPAERSGVGSSVTIPGVAKPLTITAIDDGNVTLAGDITGAIAGAPVLAGAKVLAVVTTITPGQAVVAPLVTQSCGNLFDCAKLNG